MILNERSLKELNGVDYLLVACVKRASMKCPIPFIVTDGIRSKKEQEVLFKSGASKTMNSAHLVGHAVDLVPIINDKPRWEWELIYPIAEHMREAARDLDLDIVWGGCWDINFTKTTDPAELLKEQYVKRRREFLKKNNRPHEKVFIDGPHYEKMRAK